jgi:uncharacterized protein (TIGR02246 family)
VSTVVAARTTQAVLEHHLQTFGAFDLDGILADYNEDSVLVLPNVVLRGREAISGFFSQGFEEFRQPGTTSQLIATQVVGDCALVVWSGETAVNRYEMATDTFFIRNGVIKVHTFAAKVTPKS